MKVHEGKLVLPTLTRMTAVANAGGLRIVKSYHGFMYDLATKKLIYHYKLRHDARHTWHLTEQEKHALVVLRRIDDSLLMDVSDVATKELGNLPLQIEDEVKELALERLKDCLGYSEIAIPQRYKKQAWERFAHNIRVVSE